MKFVAVSDGINVPSVVMLYYLKAKTPVIQMIRYASLTDKLDIKGKNIIIVIGKAKEVP